MSRMQTQQIAEKCDCLSQECDSLLDSADYVDSEIKRLSTAANNAMVQISLLEHAQANLERQLRALSWRLFWSNLRPTFILARLSRALGSRHHGWRLR
jgi:hypothetical protein